MLVDVSLMVLDVDVDAAVDVYADVDDDAAAADDDDDAAAAAAADDDDDDDDDAGVVGGGGGGTLNRTFVCLYNVCAWFLVIFRFFQVGENTLSNQMRRRVVLWSGFFIELMFSEWNAIEDRTLARKDWDFQAGVPVLQHENWAAIGTLAMPPKTNTTSSW